MADCDDLSALFAQFAASILTKDAGLKSCE
jgi:hypothetical protein